MLLSATCINSSLSSNASLSILYSNRLQSTTLECFWSTGDHSQFHDNRGKDCGKLRMCFHHSEQVLWGTCLVIRESQLVSWHSWSHKPLGHLVRVCSYLFLDSRSSWCLFTNLHEVH
jgi:hypothetical protein